MIITLENMQARVGSELGVSDWMIISQDMIDQFAELTGDDQFHHIDVERAKDTPFGGTIAHGLLTLSLLRAMYVSSNAPRVEGTKIAISYGANRLRFTAPVRSGARVRGRFKLHDLHVKSPKLVLLTYEFTVEIEGESRPALVAEWLVQLTF